MNYNAVISVRDVTDESGTITEPVSLDEIKNYLRLEGFEDVASIVPESPISITLLAGQTSVQDDRLIDAVILTLSREGVVYTQSLVVGNRKFVYSNNGTVTFLNAGEVGGETIDITFGYTNATGIFNFTNDDDLLREMITAARELIEEKSGLSLVFHTWEAWLTNLCGMQEIPYGPIIGSPVVKDSLGNTLTFTVAGNLWKYLLSPMYKNIVLTYNAGYGDVLTAPLPKAIKMDIMRVVAYMYENRGEDAKISEFVWQLSSKYSRNTAIV